MWRMDRARREPELRVERALSMDQPRALADLSEGERNQALARFRILQPFFDGQTSLTAIARKQAVTLRTLQRWVTGSRQHWNRK